MTMIRDPVCRSTETYECAREPVRMWIPEKEIAWI